MNVAYVISAYKLPSLLVRLVRRLDAPGTSFFIHVDAKTSAGEYRAMTEPLADRENVQFLPRHPCYWGDFGHVRATLKGMAALLESRRPFDYVVLLTGQDYPLRSNAAIAEALRQADGRVLMRASPLPNQHWSEGGMDRIEHWHFRFRGRPLSFPGAPFRSAAANAAWSLPARVLRLRRRFPGGLQPYGGSSYWSMPADCVPYVLETVSRDPGFAEFFQHVHVPDEIFFHTLVMNSPFRDRVSADDLRYHDWEAGADHPGILTIADFEKLMRSGKLFARKFDPTVDAAVLDRIDRSIDGPASTTMSPGADVSGPRADR
jgi:hypothetical protein